MCSKTSFRRTASKYFVRKGDRFEIALHYAVFESGVTMRQPDFVRAEFETYGVDVAAFGQREDIFTRAAATIEEPRLRRLQQRRQDAESLLQV